MAKMLLVPVDGSEHSFNAVDVACLLARQLDATLRLVQVVPDLAIPEGLERFAQLEHVRGPVRYVYEDAVAEKVLNAGRDRAAAGGVKTVEMSIEYGDAAKGILAAAKLHGAEMIVMGTRGLGNVQGLFLGSVAHKVCHGASCRVIMVK